jgi:hypothetical protein
LEDFVTKTLLPFLVLDAFKAARYATDSGYANHEWVTGFVAGRTGESVTLGEVGPIIGYLEAKGVLLQAEPHGFSLSSHWAARL